MALRDDLHAWFSTQPLWEQDLARRLVSRPRLDGSDYDEALSVVKAAFGALADGETAPNPKPLALEDLPAGATTGAPRLTAFGRLRGVGAVSSEHELRFTLEGLTVIYGQNATGKTTYVRALKRVCRAVDRDAEVRGNVFAPGGAGADGPTAKVELSVSAELRAQQLNLADPPDLGLDAISVFDAQCAELYVDSQNAVAFVPASLLLLARLAATQNEMRQDLDNEANGLRREAPRFPELTGDTTARRFLAGLSAQTKLADVQALATLDETERARLTELHAAITAAEARSAHADAQAAREDARQAAAVATQIRELGTRVAQGAREKLAEVAKHAADTEAAAELANREFSDLPVAGVGGGPWRHLWQAAREFAEGAGVAFPPARGDPCPLCLQETAPGAAARLAHFEEHVRSAVQADARKAREALDAALEPLDARHVEACRSAFLSGLTEREPELHAAVEDHLQAIGTIMQSLRSDPADAEVAPVASEPVDRLEQGVSLAVRTPTRC